VNGLVVIWSMVSAACAMLGLVQLFLWINRPREPAYALSLLMAFAAAAVAIIEMNLFLTDEPERYQVILRWQNFAAAGVVVPMVWSVKAYLPIARTWLAALITALWVAGVIVNSFMPGNLTFTEVTSLERHVTPWGDPFFVPLGIANPFKWLADVTVLLVPLYLIDAAWRSRRRHWGRRSAVISGGVMLFILFAGVHSILVDAGFIDSPYMISVAFLSVVLSLTWVLARDALQAREMADEVILARRETERLLRANLLGEVAGSLAHELNQPLAAILGNAQAAKSFMDRPEPDLDEVRHILDDIVRDDKRARDIIQDMRRLLQGDQSGYEKLNLEPLVREILQIAQTELAANDVSIRVKTDQGLAAVQGARVALQQVVLNLILNAERAIVETPDVRREILLHLCGDGDDVLLEVRDFGPGIAEELIDRIFDPFVTTRKNSVGMGLAFSRRIVESHGGRLTAENHPQGGALFRIRLPALAT
jgi:signal transduction histidine kinase